MRQLTSFIVYLAIGALCHALFYSSTIDLNNAWTLVWLVLWPLMLFAYFWFYALIVCAVFIVGIGAFVAYDAYVNGNSP